MPRSSHCILPTCLLLSALLALAACGRNASVAERDDQTSQESSPPPLTARPLPQPPAPPPTAAIHKLPAPTLSRTFPFLPGEDPLATVSVGDTRDGYLINGTPLPLPGPDYDVLPIQYTRDISYGTEEVIALILHAASQVAEQFPGAVLYLGNLGRQEGGDIPYSISHNAGRDFDLAYFATDPLGWHSPPPDFVTFNRSLRSKEFNGFYRFDVPRNAALMVALVTHPDIHVQYIFIARHLQRAIMDHLKAEADEDETITTARERLLQVMYEPRGSAPHDDHAHVRLFCSDRDLCGGCVDVGRRHPWLSPAESVMAACLERVATVLYEAPQPRDRAAAIDRLELLGATATHRDTIVAALEDPSPMVRKASLQALANLPDTSHIIIEHDRRETHPAVRCRTIAALAGQPSAATIAHLGTLLSLDIACEDLNPPEPIAARAAHALARVDHPDAVAPLVAILATAPPAVRQAAAAALTNLTNRGDDHPWLELEGDALGAALDGWQQWWEKNQRSSRDAWLIAGFRDAGLNVRQLDNKAIPLLLDAITAAPHLSYNAQRVLMRLSRTSPPSLSWSTDDALWHWTRYFKRNARKFKVDLSDRNERGQRLR